MKFLLLFCALLHGTRIYGVPTSEVKCYLTYMSCVLLFMTVSYFRPTIKKVPRLRLP